MRRTRGLTRRRARSATDSLSDDATVGYSVVGDAPEYEWASDPRIREIISELIADIALEREGRRRFRAASAEGSILRVCLSAITMCIMIDEPTNHLDIRAIAWLARASQ